MKKIYTILLFVLLMIPLKVSATGLSISLSCPSSAKAGATVSCTIKGDVSGGTLTGLNAKFSYGNGLIFSSFTPGSGWSNYYSSQSGFSIGNISGKSGSGISFGTLKVTIPKSAIVNSSYSVTINSIDGSDSGGNSVTASGKTATIKVLSGNNNLSSLKLSNGTINFSSGQTNYSVTINSATTVVTATLADSSASFVSGYGSRTINLSYGSNNYYIKVKAANGDVKTYTINITRPDGRSTENTLKSLTVSNGKISFSPNTLEYSLNVAENVSSIKIDAVPSHSKASLVSGYGSRTVNLNYGNNKVLVKVKAENGSEKTYTLNVFRNDGREDNNYLKELEIVGYKLNFNKEKFEYNLNVLYELEKLDMKIVTDSNKAKYDVNGNSLIVGENTVTITVTAENEQKRTYTIYVNKLNAGELLPSADISNLTIEGYNLKFSKDKLKYTIEVKNDNPLDIKVELVNKDSTYKIIGNRNLNDKDEITILVISTDLETKEYVIYIVRNEINSAVIISVIIITILILVLIYLYNNLVKVKNLNSTMVPRNDIYINNTKNNIVEETMEVHNPVVEPINLDELDKLNNRVVEPVMVRPEENKFIIKNVDEDVEKLDSNIKEEFLAEESIKVENTPISMEKELDNLWGMLEKQTIDLKAEESEEIVVNIPTLEEIKKEKETIKTSYEELREPVVIVQKSNVSFLDEEDKKENKNVAFLDE